MTHSAEELSAVTLLKRERVATMNAIRQKLGVSHMTVFRALRNYGYLTSYNFNARYYTLADIPSFDQYGLWTYGEVRFSRYGTVDQTIVQLVQHSAGGFTITELQHRLGTHVHNQVSQLFQAKRLTRLTIGRCSFYMSVEPKQQTNQEKVRREQSVKPVLRPKHREKGRLGIPEGLDISVVLEMLVEMIRAPELSEASLSRRLQGRGVAIKAGQVREVMGYYSLKKKRHLSSSNARKRITR